VLSLTPFSRLQALAPALGKRSAPEQSRGVAHSGATTTNDALLGGSLRLVQPRTGYRVNVDSLLLVAFAGERRVERVVDLGAGVGALGLLALYRGIAGRALLVEADPKLVLLARHNLEQAKLRGEVRELDLTRHKLPETGVALVLCNPPYYPASSHRPAQSPAQAAARSGELGPFLRAASGLVARKTGRALFSYPAPQLPELLFAAAAAGLVPKRLRLVHARETEPARLALIELRAARPGGLLIEPPLFEWLGRKRSPELLALSGERAADRK
jgi:tRNA1Val (adenine37-N6)-methyltransferase